MEKIGCTATSTLPLGKARGVAAAPPEVAASKARGGEKSSAVNREDGAFPASPDAESSIAASFPAAVFTSMSPAARGSAVDSGIVREMASLLAFSVSSESAAVASGEGGFKSEAPIFAFFNFISARVANSTLKAKTRARQRCNS